MRLFGWELRRVTARDKGVSRVPSSSNGGWFSLIVREPFTGAWQKNQELAVDTVLAHHAVYGCVTLIANDVGKLRQKLVQQNPETGIWSEVTRPAFSPLLKKPNRYQNHIQFKELWISSKLLRGNTYALKVRDGRGVVTALYILDPSRVTPLVAEDGSIYYDLSADNLSGIPIERRAVPASEIIHDRMNCLFHPLVGISPIYASGLSATVGLEIEQNAAGFFGNGSNPSGILTAPGKISEPVAERLKEHWEREYTGRNSGKVAVLGDDLKFQPMRMSAVDAQMIEHLKWTAETVCSTYHVPPFKLGIGTMPTYQNGEVLNQIYYSDCLQSLIEQYEASMDDGLGLDEKKSGTQLGVELDLDGLLRMDTATQVRTLGEGVKSSVFAPNEARRKVDLPPLAGGDTVYMQQQNYSLAALDARDRGNPFPAPSGDTPASPATDDIEIDDDEARRILSLRVTKYYPEALAA